MKTRILKGVAAATIAASLVGCGQSAGNTPASSPGAGTSSGAAGREDAYTVTYMHKTNGDEKFLGNDSFNDNVWTRYYRDSLGITLDYKVAAAGDDYDQKMSMAIASNSLPDIMDLSPSQFQDLAAAGKLADLSQVYEDNASDLLKQTIEVDGGVQLASGKIDGKLYGIPQLAAADGTGDLLWIRTDWLKALNLEAPTTMDELLDVAKAFRFNDPDGDGAEDTWGIGFQKDIVTESGASPGSFDGFFAAYGAYPRAWIKDDSGKISYSGIMPGAKQALAQLSQMYKDGLIDPEFGVKDATKLGEDIASGKVGMFYGNEGIPWGATKSCVENDPNADWQCYPIVSATDKPAKPATYVRISRYFAVNANCKHPEALIKIANAFQDKINSLDSTEETLNTFGVDPKTGVNFAAVAAFGMDPAIQKCNTYYAEIKATLDGETTVDKIHPEAARYYKAIKQFIDNGMNGHDDPVGWNYYKFIGPEGSWNTIINDYKANDKLVSSVFFGAPTPTMKSNLSSLDKLEAETYVNTIMGTSDPSAFDGFVDQWKQLGGDQITTEVNNWYNTTFADLSK